MACSCGKQIERPSKQVVKKTVQVNKSVRTGTKRVVRRGLRYF